MRKNKVAYTVVNDIIKSSKISTFADIIEGEIKHEDRILLVGCILDTYIDHDDMQSMLDDSTYRNTPLIDEVDGLLSKRCNEEEVPYIYEYTVEDYVPGFAGKI
jgi:hypothetical protein